MTIVHKYSGPPGTGKSTTLLNVVNDLLKAEVAPEDIVYTTFTRAGAYEARDRACSRFNLPPTRFPYFRTLHALCYQALPKSDLMDNRDWCEIAAQSGYAFTLKKPQDEQAVYGATKGDILLSLWLLARTTSRTVSDIFLNAYEEFQINYTGIAQLELEMFIQRVQLYKDTHGKLDYTDMLEYWLKGTQYSGGYSPYLIVDEAQDLSPLQWQVVDKLAQGAKEMWVAGDDDQCIHEWNGASRRHFMQLKYDHYTVLPQSYRIPSTIHHLANQIITKVTDRLPKLYHPREELGEIHYTNNIESIDLSKGTWMLLARNICFLHQYVNLCRHAGVLFTGNVAGAVKDSILRAIETWQNLQKGSAITAGDAKNMYHFMSQRDRVTRGFKKVLDAVLDPVQVNLAQLVASYGLITDIKSHWAEALDMIPDADTIYLTKVERNGALENRVLISTIHGVKGKEADHVVIDPSMTHRTWHSGLKNTDAEHRVFYVAVTRARKTLHILRNGSDYSYNL